MKEETAEKREALANTIAALIAERGGNVNVASLCLELGYSETQCRGAFFARMGETMEQFAKRLRLERAAMALSESKRKICEIALDTGYSSHEGLDRAFGSYFGCSPTLYKENNPIPPPFPSGSCTDGICSTGRIDVGVCIAAGAVLTFCCDSLQILGRIEPDIYNYQYNAEDVKKHGF